MRWLVALAIVVIAAPATARERVIERPPHVRACMTGSSWSELARCLAAHGSPTVVRALRGAKLVRLDHTRGIAEVDGELLLYVPADKGWRLAGAYEPRGDAHELLDLAPLTSEGETWFRIDIGEVSRTRGPLDVDAAPAVFLVHRVLLCGGAGWRCADVIVGCDVLVHGIARWTFHGALAISDGVLEIVGDRRRTGPFCRVPNGPQLLHVPDAQ